MLEITGIKFMWCLLGIGVVLIGIIAAIRRQMTRTGEQLAQSDAPSTSRRQHREMNVFRHTPTFFRFGMVLSLLLVIFAFNWTTYEREVYIPPIEDGWEDDIETTPRAPEPPKPSPPPPPLPEIVEVEPEEVEEEVIFEDQTMDVEEVVEAPEPPKPPKPTLKELPKPEPPPPPIVVEEKPDSEIFVNVREMPRFAGCEEIGGTSSDKKQCSEKRMLQFIYSKIKYPTIARESNIEGLVVIGFIIEKDGSISGAKILRDIGGGCGAEALRIINSMPDWIPGYQRTKPVRVQFNMPVKFKLQG